MAEPSGADAAALYRRTGGNPFFVTELLTHDIGIPETVADAVLARAARLDPPTREALEAVAVLGPSAELWVLDQILPNADHRLDDAVAGGLLQPRGEALSFRNELAREAVLSAIGAYRKASLHRAALEALRSPSWGEPDEVRLAHHAIGAGDPGPILEIAPRAAEQASAGGAHREAALLYEHAARFADALPLEQQAALFGAMSQELFNITQFKTAEAAQRRALACYEELGDEMSQGAAGTWLANLAWQAGSLPQALEVVQAAVADLERLPPGGELLAAYCQLAQLLLAAEDPKAAGEWSERAAALAARTDRGDATVLAMLTAGWIEMFNSGREGLEKLERVAELAGEAGVHAAARSSFSSPSRPLLRHLYPAGREHRQDGRVAPIGARRQCRGTLRPLARRLRVLAASGRWASFGSTPRAARRPGGSRSKVGGDGGLGPPPAPAAVIRAPSFPARCLPPPGSFRHRAPRSTRAPDAVPPPPFKVRDVEELLAHCTDGPPPCCRGSASAT